METRRDKLLKINKILFYVLITIVGVWIVASVITIPVYLDPTQSAPWYTGIILVTIIFSIPIIVLSVVFLILHLLIKKEEQKEQSAGTEEQNQDEEVEESKEEAETEKEE